MNSKIETIKKSFAKAKSIRTSPQKLNLVSRMIRNKPVNIALAQLKFSKKRIANDVRKCLESAIANAENNLGLDPSSLVITTATADMGPPMKRYRPRAQGRAFAIKKQTCHISIAVSANQSNNSEDSD